ncbi:hypothetical protein [Novosphingobium naphthalenivorans]|uniref:hypothetical protein n=1 Tax=Novosphingobium naphthalenivorans TaxID=273168 RepID=UPI000A838359|nr:hypothetical protein [Novosphingobium naphthalenivorans]
MGLLTLSAERAAAFRRFRRNTWKAIALCAALRMADAGLGLGLLASVPSHAGQSATGEEGAGDYSPVFAGCGGAGCGAAAGRWDHAFTEAEPGRRPRYPAR